MSETERGGWQGCWREEGGVAGWWRAVDGSGWVITPPRYPPPRLCTDLVWSSSDNKAAHRNPACGTYLGSDQWAGTGWEGSRGSRECVPAAREVRKRPRMALTNFLKLGKRKECVECSHSLLLAICTYTDRLRHGVSKYLLHTHTCLHTCTSSLGAHTIQNWSTCIMQSLHFAPYVL